MQHLYGNARRNIADNRHIIYKNNRNGGLKLDLILKVYNLWMQHSEWTRMAFASMIFGNPDEDAVTARLLRNPVDFYYLLRQFFGETAALKFRDLLSEHLMLAGDLVKATMAGDSSKANSVNTRLYRNADQISDLLSSINPFWSYDEWRDMMYMHLDLAKKIAQEMINGSYEDSINTYDKFEAEVLSMADMMASGLINYINRMPY